jgi:phosphatidylinositol alpha-1,6-mannosyltransferase
MRFLYLGIGFLGVGGGIASAARSLIDALAGRYTSERHDVVSHSLRGHESTAMELPISPNVVVRGFESDRVRFAVSSWQEAVRLRPTWVFADHINMLPVAVAAAALSGARLALFLHGKEIYGAESEPGLLTYRPPRHLRAIARRADVLFANSPWTARLANESLELSTSPVVTWLPIEERKLPFLERARRAEQPTRKYLLIVSRIDAADDSKGHRRLFEMLKRQTGSMPLHVVGSGRGRGALQQLADECGLRDRVQIHGFVDERALAKLYAGATALVMPSTGEGLGLVYMEAVAAGSVAIGASPGPIDDLRRDFGPAYVPLTAGSDLPTILEALSLRHDSELRRAWPSAELFAKRLLEPLRRAAS